MSGTKNKIRQNFLYGAIILMMANLLVKIIGAVFKIPLLGVLTDDGMGYFNSAYNIYVGFYMIATTGLPVALSRMIAVSNAQGNRAEVKRIFNLSLLIFFILGLLSGFIMFFGAKSLSAIVANSNAYLCIIAIAPTIFFICLASSFRGYFQGLQDMVPTAVSQVIEALGKLGIGIIAGLYAVSQGYDLLVIAAYAISGITIGVAVGTVYLFITKSIVRDSMLNPEPAVKLRVRSRKSIVKELIYIALPITISTSLLSLTNIIDLMIMMRRLQHIGFSEEVANKLWGAYSTRAQTLFNMPLSLIYPFAMSIIPVLAASYMLGNFEKIKKTVESTFRVVTIISIPCALGMSAMSYPVISFLFGESDMSQTIAPLLSILSIAIFFAAIVSVSNSMLQAQNLERKPILSMICGAVVKLITSYILVGIPQIGIYGTPISTTLCFLTIMCINIYFLAKYTKYIPSIRRTFLKPFLAASACALAALATYSIIENMVRQRIATLAALCVAVLIYFIMLILLKAVDRDDILLLPKGKKIADFLERIKFIKSEQ